MDDDQLSERAKARVGSTLRGKYRIDRVLGVGGMAVVYAATHRNAKRFAVKMLHPELSMSSDVRMRFMREGYAANSVEHPGTVAVLDDDVAEDGAAFIVMELLDGTGVDFLCEANGNQLPLRVAVTIVDQLLDVLSAAHQRGIVHRDIKPANLFATRDGTVKVLDFGIARARDAMQNASGGATGTGMLLGTPAFMAPEQALAKSSEIDAQTDVWAAAATFFFLLTGQFVHTGDNAPQLLIAAATAQARPIAILVPNLPAPIAQVIDRGLAFDKRARWLSAAAMRDALREAYRAVAGALPERVPLDAMAAGAPGPQSLAVPFSGATPPPALTPWPSTPGAASHQLTPSPMVQGATTAQPVAGTPAPAATGEIAPPKRLGVPIAIAGGALSLGVIAVVAAFGLRGKGATRPGSVGAEATSATAALVAPPPSASPAPVAAPSPSPSPAMPLAPAETSTAVASASPSSKAEPAKPARPQKASQGGPSAGGAASAAAHASAAQAAAKPNCDPNYTLDDQGRKHWKPECFSK